MWWRPNTNPLPWKVFVPDRVTALTVAPVDCPNRAERTPLSTLNSWSASGNGIALPVLFCGSLLEPPSTRYCVLLPVPPATEMDTALGYCRLSVRPPTCTAPPDRMINCVGVPAVERQADDLLLLDDPADADVARLDQRRVGLDAHGFGQRADLIVTFTDRVSPTASTIPVCSKMLNPSIFADSL